MAGKGATVAALSYLIRSQRLPREPKGDHGGSDDSLALRERLHAAIDIMPAEELRRIVIPVGYLFQD